MEPHFAQQVEVETLHEILVEIDHYAILRLTTDCTQDEIHEAFREESRRMHPDRFAAFPVDEIKQKAGDIYKAVNKAYKVLKNPDTRADYDQELRDDGKGDGGEDEMSNAARHPMAEKYWALALQNWEEENFKGCVMNIKFCLNYEPENEVFKELLDKAQAAAIEMAKDHNPYKLRLS